MRTAIVALALAFMSVHVAGADVRYDDEVRDRFLVVVGSSDDFHAAKKRALAASRSSGTPFYERGLVFDKKRGLILPDDSGDDIYAGGYLLRRANEELLGDSGPWSPFISVERADAYDLDEAAYVVIGGIYDSADEAQRAATRLGAHVEKSRIYMGCMH